MTTKGKKQGKTTKKPATKKRKPARRPVPQQVSPLDERDMMGFSKRDYPLIAIVGIIALNVWGFNAGTAVSICSAVGVDLIVVYWLYKRFWPKAEPTQEAKTSTKPSAKTTKSDVPEGGEKGLFGIKRKHYPLLVGVVILLVNITAFRGGWMPFVILAVLVDVAVLYLLYRKYGLPRITTKPKKRGRR